MYELSAKNDRLSKLSRMSLFIVHDRNAFRHMDMDCPVIAVHFQIFLPLSGTAVRNQNSGRTVLKLNLSCGKGFVIPVCILGDGFDILCFSTEIPHQVYHVDSIFQCCVIFGLRTVFLSNHDIRRLVSPYFLGFGYNRSVPSVKSDHQFPACLLCKICNLIAASECCRHRLFTVGIHSMA